MAGTDPGALHGEGIGPIVVHGGEVIHPITIRDDLLIIGHVLRMLLKTAMEIADVGDHIHDDFAIQNHFEAQHTMRGGVLWSHVDDHFIGTKGPAAGSLEFAGMCNVSGGECSCFRHAGWKELIRNFHAVVEFRNLVVLA